MSLSLYDHDDYKAYLRAWLLDQPKHGRGLLTQMARHLAISSTMLSHVLGGDKHLSLENAHDLAVFLGLGEAESDYFLLLVLRLRAGSVRLRERFEARIKRARTEANRIAHRIKADRQLTDTAKATFYSDWIYSAIRNLTACPSYGHLDAIADHLQMPRARIAPVVDFLLAHGLCVMEDGRLRPGVKQIHIDARSSLVQLHHRNWRLHGFSKVASADERSLFFTAPMSLSAATADEIRQMLLRLIEEMRERVRPSPSEEVRCLNIDWFGY